MTKETDIIIAGSGLNGSALALALADVGFNVTLIDPMPDSALTAESFDGRGYALALTSQRLLKAIGVWDQVNSHSQPILEIKVSDGRAGEGPSPFVLEFDHAEIEEGPMGYMLEDRFLRRALIDRLSNHPHITRISGDSVVAQSADTAQVAVTLNSGKLLHGALLIGCDGRRSGVATRAGIKRSFHNYGQTALVCAIKHDLPHHGIAHQFFMPPGPLAILPLPGNQSSIVWTETEETATRIQAMNDNDYLQTLRPRFGSFLGKISLVGARFSYPLNLTVADRFVADRIALVGDAAHGVHPIAGQGLNAGLKDVGALAEVLALARRRGEDIGRLDVLERYQQWRRFDVATLAAATHAVNKLFSNDNPALRIGRDIGMALVNSLPGLRRTLIREAAGLSGDVPKLLQGRQI
ncbi:MAG: UbiH/UbiF/VisC/COQ6 family ubiquinone biosynthesis hydroxylase [Paracoccaceae bacterium]|nr:UbiH/UbiF/VisC/COQ6 family ubiquinone biosynthesis hydroxylase [Paracoccaceae bacterium]